MPKWIPCGDGFIEAPPFCDAMKVSNVESK